MKTWGKVVLIIFGIMAALAAIVIIAAAIIESNAPQCRTQEEFITVAGYGCTEDSDCSCSDTNLLGICNECSCRTTRRVCQ